MFFTFSVVARIFFAHFIIDRARFVVICEFSVVSAEFAVLRTVLCLVSVQSLLDLSFFEIS